MKEKIEKIRKILIAPAIITYVPFTFIQWDYNPANWHIVTRYICFTFYFILVMAAVADQVNKDNETRRA